MRKVYINGSAYLRDGFDLGSQLLLDSVEGEPVFVGDQVDRNTQVTEPYHLELLNKHSHAP